jgi:histone-binding protein RBBP4
LSKIGDETKQDENVDGPQELVFSHRGHKSQLSDFSMHPGSGMYVASVDNDMNHLTVWQLASNMLEVENVL